MTSKVQAQPRWTFSVLMIVLATSIPFVVAGVDPMLLSLNLPAIRQGLEIPSDLVGFIGSAATLVMAAAVLGVGNLGDLYGHKRLLIYRLIGNVVFQPLTIVSPNAEVLIVMRFLDALGRTIGRRKAYGRSAGWPLWTGAMPQPCFFSLFTNDLEEVYSEGRTPNSPRGNLLLGEDGIACRTLR